MRFVYHLGVHKTGSTLLQENIAANVRPLRAQGVFCVNVVRKNLIHRIRHALRRKQNPHRTGQLPPDALAIVNQRVLISATGAGAHTALISEENFLGPALHREMSYTDAPAQFYPRAAACLDVLTRTVPSHDITIILYSRHLDGLLRGYYCEALRALQTTDSFDRFLDRVDIASFRFDGLVERLRPVAPDAEIIVKPFETIRADAEGFVADFFAACGADPSGLRFQSNVVRPALDLSQAEELRAIAARLQSGGRLRLLRRRARAIAETPGARDNPITLPDRHRERIEDTMRRDVLQSAEPLCQPRSHSA